MDNKEKCTKYFNEHREEDRARCKRYYLAHREEIIARTSKYAQEHKEKIKEYRKEYNKRDYRKQQTLGYRIKNRDKIRLQSREHNRRIKYEVLSYYSVEDIPICEGCLKKGNRTTDLNLLTIDHIYGDGAKHCKEIGGGGRVLYAWLKHNNYPEGYRVLCFGCNLHRRRQGYEI
jgi:hypothetical protein